MADEQCRAVGERRARVGKGSQLVLNQAAVASAATANRRPAAERWHLAEADGAK